MLKFEKTDKRKYSLYSVNGEEKTKIVDLDLVYTPGSNKYDNMITFVEDCSTNIGTEFDNWYIGLIQSYISSNYDFRIIKTSIPQLITFCNQYIEILNINFDGYINKSKVSKNSIFFNADEIKEVIKTACYLKVYYSIHKDLNMKLNTKFHKEVFRMLVANLTESPIIIKLHKIVSSKTFEYNMTDKYMWEYIKSICCKTPDMHISHIFNFIINNIIVTCEVNSNPIPYLISVIDESIKWFLKSIYKESIIYSDAISTQDVNAVSGKDNLETYAHNDTIGKLIILAHQSLDNVFGTENDDAAIDQFKTILSGIKDTSLFSCYFTYPILSKVLDIPYRHFLTLSASNSYLLNVLLFDLMPEELSTEYPTLNKILLFYNTQKSITKTTYKLKNLTIFTSTFDHFCGFKNYTTPYDIYSTIIGKINRNEYSSFATGREVPNISLNLLESELIAFYNKYFSNQFEPIFDGIRERIDQLS